MLNELYSTSSNHHLKEIDASTLDLGAEAYVHVQKKA
jgi:hypothetical protein